jgi:hypothetical protein
MTAYLMLACSKLKVSQKAPTKGGSTDAVSPLMWLEKVQLMAKTTAAGSPPKVSAMAQTRGSLKTGLTLTVARKALWNERLTTNWILMELEQVTAFLKARLKPNVS